MKIKKVHSMIIQVQKNRSVIRYLILQYTLLKLEHNNTMICIVENDAVIANELLTTLLLKYYTGN